MLFIAIPLMRNPSYISNILSTCKFNLSWNCPFEQLCSLSFCPPSTRSKAADAALTEKIRLHLGRSFSRRFRSFLSTNPSTASSFLCLSSSTLRQFGFFSMSSLIAVCLLVHSEHFSPISKMPLQYHDWNLITLTVALETLKSDSDWQQENTYTTQFSKLLRGF